MSINFGTSDVGESGDVQPMNYTPVQTQVEHRTYNIYSYHTSNESVVTQNTEEAVAMEDKKPVAKPVQ
jgi:hypothetical protein